MKKTIEKTCTIIILIIIIINIFPTYNLAQIDISDFTYIEQSSITLNKTDIILNINKTVTLNATVLPSNATNKSVIWESSNNNIATVDNTGMVTAKKNGTATITAKTHNGKIAKCNVTVKTSPTSLKLNKTSAVLYLYYGTKTINLKATPVTSVKNTTINADKKITWSSSNSKVATVNKSGKVTAKKAGNTTITAKTHNGKIAKCKITVSNKITGGQAIAEAAVKIACTAHPQNPLWSNAKTRIYNKQTKAYVSAHDSLLKNYPYYASCDAGAATAVRYSKVDSRFEWRTVPRQWNYVENSKSWKKVGTFNGTSTKNLKPGDVLLENHIMIYTGNTIVRVRFPNSSANLYEASYGRFYPRLTLASTRKGHKTCSVFRHVNSNKRNYSKIL